VRSLARTAGGCSPSQLTRPRGSGRRRPAYPLSPASSWPLSNTPTWSITRSLVQTANGCRLPPETRPRGSGKLRGGKLLATFEGHTEAVNSAVFSVDGRRVLTASEDGTARLWPLLPDDIPIPEWFDDFLVWLGGKRIPNGQIETLSGDELGKLEATFGRTWTRIPITPGYCAGGY
jgi:WD40 repeat protein